jgi:hypothetical protein
VIYGEISSYDHLLDNNIVLLSDPKQWCSRPVEMERATSSDCAQNLVTFSSQIQFR